MNVQKHDQFARPAKAPVKRAPAKPARPRANSAPAKTTEAAKGKDKLSRKHYEKEIEKIQVEL